MLGVLSIGWIVSLIVFLVGLSMHSRIVLSTALVTVSIASVTLSISLVWEAQRASLGPRALWVALGVYLDADSWNLVLDAFCSSEYVQNLLNVCAKMVIMLQVQRLHVCHLYRSEAVS